MKTLLAGALGAFVALTPQLAQAAITDPVTVESGELAGASTATPSVRVFKGIPFAAPPTGENRWRAPQPAAKWQGVRKADAFGAPCLANAGAGGGRGGAGGGRRGGGAPGAPGIAPGGGGRRGAAPGGAAPGAPAAAAPAAAATAAAPAAAPAAPAPPRAPAASEDCLFLNVWTSAERPSDKKLVMLFVYGGGFFSGAGSEARYDSERMASKGVVAVTIN